MTTHEAVPELPLSMTGAIMFRRYDVSQEQAECALLSVVARGIDAFLADDALSNVDGSCRVPASRFKAWCEKAGVTKPGVVWKELVSTGRWMLSDDGQWLISVKGLAQRAEIHAFREKRRQAGKVSGERRRAKSAAMQAKAAKRKADQGLTAAPQENRTRVQREQVFEVESEHATEGNPFPPQDFEHHRTGVQPELRTEHTTSDLVSQDQEVVLPSVDAACHAEGAAAPPAEPVAPRRVPNLRVLMVEEQLRDTVIIPGWMDAETAALVRQLAARGTLLRVEVERAIGRLYAPLCSDRTPLGHVPLRDELGALLRGEAGRDGWLPVAQAPEAVICALFGALTHRTPRISPLLFRAIAIETAKAMAAQPDADGRELAADITQAFDHGSRQASGYLLAPECTTPTRLNGYPTKSEATA
jgi:hypothetical protein